MLFEHLGFLMRAIGFDVHSEKEYRMNYVSAWPSEGRAITLSGMRQFKGYDRQQYRSVCIVSQTLKYWQHSNTVPL